MRSPGLPHRDLRFLQGPDLAFLGCFPAFGRASHSHQRTPPGSFQAFICACGDFFESATNWTSLSFPNLYHRQTQQDFSLGLSPAA